MKPKKCPICHQRLNQGGICKQRSDHYYDVATCCGQCGGPFTCRKCRAHAPGGICDERICSCPKCPICDAVMYQDTWGEMWCTAPTHSYRTDSCLEQYIWTTDDGHILYLNPNHVHGFGGSLYYNGCSVWIDNLDDLDFDPKNPAALLTMFKTFQAVE